MLKTTYKLLAIVLFFTLFSACKNSNTIGQLSKEDSLMNAKVNEYAVVKLTASTNNLTANELKMLPILIDIAKIMDNLYWEQTIGPRGTFVDTIKNPLTKNFAEINYGPWDRLDGEKSFMKGWETKPEGANFYPKDMTKEEFEKWTDKNKASQYTIIRRKKDGSLESIWYHEAYKEQLNKAAELLRKAAALADDAGLKSYLNLRAQALMTSDYFKSDMAWMDMKTNTLDMVVGPIENYEDKLFGYKTAFEAAVLIKDKDWSRKLAHFSSMLPELQKSLPCDSIYKKEVPGSNSDLNAYDIVYYAGHSNVGGKTIAINLPNDEKVQLEKGSRRLQLKNTMKAKFDKILSPIAEQLIDPSQRKNIKFEAFFSNVMFHEVSHGLGIKNTITGKGNIRVAIKELYSAIEEAKADILGLWMVTTLIDKGELKDITKEDAYVTYMAGLIRSVRFGAAEAHGQANMMCLNFFEDKKAFTRTENGTYRVDFTKIPAAINEWAAMILKFEGDGDYDGAKSYLKTNGVIRPALQSDLNKLKSANIPKDIVFEQGIETLGLKK